ncbi:MAG: hypothetical protein HYV20_00360 [Gemmatimonadetes bacterium]|nr:hypothetical protein [Gemmatimonadota bacterium]
MNLARLVELGDAMHQELGREYYLTGAGLKTEPAFQAIYDRFAVLVSDEALETARASGVAPLVEWIVGIRIGRLVASLEEGQLRWEQEAVVRGGGREVPYLRVPIELANEPDRATRLALDAARAHLVAGEVTRLRRERFALEHEAVKQLGYRDYVSGSGALMGIDLPELARAGEAFLGASEALYRDALGRLVKRRLGVPLGQLARADVAWAFRADEYDAAFPLAALVETAVRQMREMGIDAHQAGRVRFDTDERAGKQPRAFCVPVRVPEEVYLVLRPRGGHNDYRTLWHELGHALHFASVGPGRSFTDRWLGDNSVTEGYAMLWDHLTLDPNWLRRYTGLRSAQVRDLRFELLVHELYGVRRYAAKLGYEIVLHGTGLSNGGPEYTRRLSDATLFRYGEEDYLQDVDPGFYAARYLRAWQLEAAVSAELTRRFDQDWFRNPRAGVLVQHLMSRGQADPADRLAAEVTGTPLSFGPLLSRLEAELQ